MANSTPPAKQIIIIGSSYAGLSTVHHLLQHVLPVLPTPNEYHIVLIGASKETSCRPACPRAMLSDDFFDQSKLFVDTAKQLARYPSEQYTFLHGRVESVDLKEGKVFVKKGDGSADELEFYAVVVASGASTPSPLLGLNSGTAQHLKKTWQTFRETLPKAKSIVIAGGGPAGVEVAGELGEYLNGTSRWFSSSSTKPKVEITLITSSANILPALRPSIAATAEFYLSSLGVKIIKYVKVDKTSPPNSGTSPATLTTPTTIHLSNGQTLEADIYIPATGTQPNTTFLPSTFLTPTGHVNTNSSTFRVEFDINTNHSIQRVYALGDCSSAFRPAIHNILSAVPILSSNIHRDILLDLNSQSSSIHADKSFKEDLRETQLVPIGTRKGVGAFMGWRMPSWFVWAIKGRDYWVWTTGKLWSGRQWG